MAIAAAERFGVTRESVATRDAAGAGAGAARRELRRQIGRLEAQLAGHVRDLSGEAPVSGGTAVGTILGVEELELTRDRLVAQLSEAQRAASERAEAEAAARVHRVAMYRDPRAHRWERITAAQAGEAGCVEYRVVPRYGPLGLLLGWWRVKVSGGCPLAAPREAARTQQRCGPSR